MNKVSTYDVAIIGGGLAGLSCAIALSNMNYRVVLFEKEQYPFHKVCGEYISRETIGFLAHIGLNIGELGATSISRLTVSSPSGRFLSHKLPLGGIGISRYSIDFKLVEIARSRGVQVLESCRVEDIVQSENAFVVKTQMGEFRSRLVCAAFGKKSNLDVRWKRKFAQTKHDSGHNYVAVKYHALLDFPRDLIALHNFKDGYCGVSPIENGRTCICYLTTAENLKHHQSINRLEQNVLCENPFLKKVFSGAEMLYDKPLTISQISFDRKKQFENDVLYLGDAASMIAPLSGNGMSMALHSSRIASKLIDDHFKRGSDLTTLGRLYETEWNKTFSRRLNAGRLIQHVFGKKWLSDTAISLGKIFPGLLTNLIRQTHG